MKLIVHIGVGKAGMTAIQRNLTKADKNLKANGAEYWGTMMDKSPIQKFSWQQPRHFKELKKVPQAQAQTDLFALLNESLEDAAQREMCVAIWSNESIFGNAELIAPVLHKLEETGVEVKVIAFVRSYDSWAQSAYVQWGIKHKRNVGPVRTFEEYFAQSGLTFAKFCKVWNAEFGPHFTLLNYDESKDVVGRFLEVTGLPAIKKPVRANEWPSPEELLFRAIYSNSKVGEVNPRQFNSLVEGKNIDFKFNAIKWLEHCLPTDEQLGGEASKYKADLDQVNDILVAKGELPLKTAAKPAKPFSVDQNKLLSICIQMLLMQAEEINELRDKLLDN